MYPTILLKEHKFMVSKVQIDPLIDPLYQRMFRIFSHFADVCPSGSLNPSQGVFILEELLRESGKLTTSRNLNFTEECVSFRELLGLLELLFPDRSELEPAADRVFERLLNHIIRKISASGSYLSRARFKNMISVGFVLYRSHHTTRGCLPITRKKKWKLVWCTLSPGVINIWPLKKGTDIVSRRTITLDRECKIGENTMENDRFLWILNTGLKSYHFSHFDQLLSRAFIHIRLAINYPTKIELAEYDRRRSLRYDSKSKSEIYYLLLKKELDMERRALKDEEIVRGLATRMLEEEKQKSEHMEKVLAELQHRLHNTITKSQRLDTVQEDEMLGTIPTRDYVDQEPDINGDEVADYIEESETVDLGREGREVWNKDFLIISTQSI
uniref:WHIM1 domain-containing protein n=1 Tax=Heterorhabditis bacteriophora TaxID=37862 RepID=A0A1I7W779_HETBA